MPCSQEVRSAPVNFMIPRKSSSVIAFAQGVRATRAQRGGALAGRRLERLQQALNLTDVQMNGVRALQENRQRETDSLQQEMQQKHQVLRQLLKTASPNATEVGNATI